MPETTSSSTGHLAMSQICTAVEPTPISSPSLPASEPVNTTASALSVNSTTVTSVTPTRIGIVL